MRTTNVLFDDGIGTWWMVINLDAVRSGKNWAASEEKGRCIAMAVEIRKWLISRGYPDCLVLSTPEGTQMCIRIEESGFYRDLLDEFRAAIRLKFETEHVKVNGPSRDNGTPDREPFCVHAPTGVKRAEDVGVCSTEQLRGIAEATRALV